MGGSLWQATTAVNDFSLAPFYLSADGWLGTGDTVDRATMTLVGFALSTLSVVAVESSGDSAANYMLTLTLSAFSTKGT